MKPLFVALFSVVSLVETANAQVICFPVAPPPPPVVVVPSVVIAPPVWVEPAPLFATTIVPAEEWRDVLYCNVRYHVNGVDYHVDNSGTHFRLGRTSSDMSANKFVEPFCPISGKRKVRHLNDVPAGATARYQSGVKTVFVVDGVELFATWIEVGNSIKTVWCQRFAVESPAPTPVPDPAFETPRSNSHGQTQEYSPLVIPSTPYDSEQRGPVMPVLPAPSSDPFVEEAPPVQQKEPTPATPTRRRQPVASRTVRV